MANTDWAKEIRDIDSAIDQADQALRDVTDWIWAHVVASDVWPRTLPESVASHLDTLHGQLNQIRRAADKAFSRLSSEPSSKAIAGLPLTREEYYLCRAMGADFGTAKEVGLIGFDDYEIYQMLCYEEDSRRCYIDVHLAPRDPQSTRPAVRGQRSPEECRRRCLRPEQHGFFREHLPGVYERFADD